MPYNRDHFSGRSANGEQLPLFWGGFTAADYDFMRQISSDEETPELVLTDKTELSRDAGSRLDMCEYAEVGEAPQHAVTSKCELSSQTASGNFMRLLQHMNLILGQWRG